MDEGFKIKTSDNCSEKVKNCYKPLLKDSARKKAIKSGIHLLFFKLIGKVAWTEAVRIVTGFSSREAVAEISKGLRE